MYTDDNREEEGKTQSKPRDRSWTWNQHASINRPFVWWHYILRIYSIVCSWTPTTKISWSFGCRCENNYLAKFHSLATRRPNTRIPCIKLSEEESQRRYMEITRDNRQLSWNHSSHCCRRSSWAAVNRHMWYIAVTYQRNLTTEQFTVVRVGCRGRDPVYLNSSLVVNGNKAHPPWLPQLVKTWGEGGENPLESAGRCPAKSLVCDAWRSWTPALWE